MKFIPAILGIATFALLCASIVLYMLYPVELVVNAFWIATALAALAWAAVSRAKIMEVLTRKSTRYGANLALVVFLVLGTLVIVNLLAKNYNWKKDLTRAGLNSLSPQTEKILGSLTQKVQAYYFGTLQDKERHEPLLKNYEHESRHFDYEFVDTARRPTFTQAMEVKKNETVVLVLEGTNKKVKVEGVSEEKVTNGLIKLLQAREEAVYFTTGHGERSLSAEDPLSYSAVKEELTKQGYTVKELNLFSEGKIPGDAAVLVVAGPARAFFPKELEILSDWLKEGGRAVFAVDLSPADSGLTKGSQQLASLLQAFGLSVQSQMLVDPMSRAANVEPQVLLGFSGSKDHPVTKDFPFSVVAANFLFPLSTHLKTSPVEGFAYTELVRTSQQAWAESDWQSLRSGVVTFNQGQDLKGQMSLAYAVESEKKEGEKPVRFIVFGTSTFATNSLLDKVGNRDLFLNAVSWLADNESLISIRPKEEGEGLKPFNNSVLNLVLLITVFAMPGIILVAGVVIWIRRSKL